MKFLVLLQFVQVQACLWIVGFTNCRKLRGIWLKLRLLTPKRHEIWNPVEHDTHLARIQSFWSQHAGALGRAFSEMIFFLAHSLNWSGWPSNADSHPYLVVWCHILHVICLLQHISSTLNGDASMPAWMCSLQPRRVTTFRHIKITILYGTQWNM